MEVCLDLSHCFFRYNWEDFYDSISFFSGSVQAVLYFVFFIIYFMGKK